MKVVILAGGFGTRISEETDLIPKPMVRVGEVPILIHLMQIFHSFGYRDFIISTGYKSYIIEEYFAKKTRVLGKVGWNVEVRNTGVDVGTSGRLSGVSDLLDQDFFITYGDGLSSLNLDNLLAFHKMQERSATVTAVRPPARFGTIEVENGCVVSFREKNPQDVGWINGGFFVMSPNILEKLDNPNESLEGSLLPYLAKKRDLSAYEYEGWWHPMDTLRDKRELDKKFAEGDTPWIKNSVVVNLFGDDSVV